MKKPNKKRKKNIENLGIGLAILFMIIMVILYIGVTSKEVENNAESDPLIAEDTPDYTRDVFVRSGEDLVDSKMMTPITDYFDLSFNALADLENTDITSLFTDNSNAQINQAALDYLIALRVNQSNDLHITNYICGLTITDVSNENGLTKITLTEDQTVNFAFTSDIASSSTGIEHVFYLQATDQGYILNAHTKEEDAFLLVEELAPNYSDAASMVSDLLSKTSDTVSTLASEKESFNNGETTNTEIAVDHPYDADAALAYAMTWVDPIEVVRNDSVFGVYDTFGGNCNNYISQCLNAGGIPMDTIGDSATQWKWYGDNTNADQSASGRSASWTGVSQFFTYASENTGYGLVAVVDDNLFSGSPGDILQFISNGEAVHSVIITQVIKDDQGNMVDYLINSNTTDRIDYPASAYGYVDFDLIKILGWNEG